MTSKGKSVATRVYESTVTEKDVEALKKKYPGFSFRKPAAGETKTSTKEGELCIYLRHLRDGLGLPIMECLQLFFQKFALVPAQLTPNSIANLVGLWRFLNNMGVKWTIPNILSLLTVASVDKGVYYVLPRDPSRLSLSGTPNAVHAWKEKFVFATCRGSWGIGTEGQTLSLDVFKGWKETEEVTKFYKDMDCAHFDLDVRSMKVKTSVLPAQKGAKAGGGQAAPLKRAVEDAEEAEDTEEAAPKRRRMPPRGAKQAPASASPEAEGVGSTEESEDGAEEEEEPEGSGRGADAGSPSAAEKTGEATEAPVTAEEAALDAAAAEVVERMRATLETQPECWLDEEQQICCYKFDKERSIVPRFHPATLPTRLIAPLLSTVDRDYLDSLPDKVVSRAHAQLLLGGAVVGKYMAVKSEKRRVAGEAREAKELDLLARVSVLEKAAAAAEAQAIQDKNGFVFREYELLERLGKTDKKEKEAREKAEEADKLNTALKAEVTRLKAVEAEGLRHRQIVDKELTQLREAAASFVPTLEEAKGVYLQSEEYKNAMGDFGEFGFELMKKALLKDQVGDPSVVQGYNYWDCIGRSAGGEL